MKFVAPKAIRCVFRQQTHSSSRSIWPGESGAAEGFLLWSFGIDRQWQKQAWHLLPLLLCSLPRQLHSSFQLVAVYLVLDHYAGLSRFSTMHPPADEVLHPIFRQGLARFFPGSYEVNNRFYVPLPLTSLRNLERARHLHALLCQLILHLQQCFGLVLSDSLERDLAHLGLSASDYLPWLSMVQEEPLDLPVVEEIDPYIRLEPWWLRITLAPWLHIVANSELYCNWLRFFPQIDAYRRCLASWDFPPGVLTLNGIHFFASSDQLVCCQVSRIRELLRVVQEASWSKRQISFRHETFPWICFHGRWNKAVVERWKKAMGVHWEGHFKTKLELHCMVAEVDWFVLERTDTQLLIHCPPWFAGVAYPPSWVVDTCIRFLQRQIPKQV